MTREEAIKILKAISVYECYPKSASEETKEALDMAIEALHREEAEANGYCHRIRPSNVEVVVRCKDCRLAQDDTTHLYCSYFRHKVYEDDFFCAYGERREE